MISILHYIHFKNQLLDKSNVTEVTKAKHSPFKIFDSKCVRAVIN